MKSKYYLLYATFFVVLLNACTYVELYEDPERDFRTNVKFAFDWVTNAQNDEYQHSVPDSMYVLAKRIVGSWKCGVKINSQTGEGYYVWNAPEGNDPDPDEWGPDNPEPADSTTVSEQDSTQNASVRTRAKSVAGVEQATDVFRIIPGFYKFITLNLDTMEFVYSDINDYMLTDESRTTLRDLCVEYKRFAYNDSKLRGTVKTWRDYNIYTHDFNYIQSDITPVYYDTISSVQIVKGKDQTLTFQPRRLTQNIDIRFHIRKKVDRKPFCIDSIYADIAGIPYRVNLSTDFIDIKRTCKMMFRSYLEDENGNRITDSESNTYLRCHGNIDVLSLVNAQDSTYTIGPGVMQVMIFLKGYQPIRGKINLYHCIKRANLFEATGNGQWARKHKDYGVLEIDSDLIIDERLIISSDEEGGFDRWIAIDDQSVVIDT